MIGVFDSGVGGLGALSVLRRRLPDQALCYLADTAYLPYGEKSAAELRQRLLKALRFFADLGARAVLIACGTASSLLPSISSPLPAMGVILPAASAADGKRILILATERTVKEQVFLRAVTAVHPEAEVHTVACPTFVSLAEDGLSAENHAEVRKAVDTQLSPFFTQKIDTVILGCTHFSLLAHAIQDKFPRARLIDSGRTAAEAFAAAIAPSDACHARTQYFVTADASGFSLRASRYLAEEIHAETVRL